MVYKAEKPPAFMLCSNPVAAKSVDRLFILHNRYPMLLAEVHCFNNTEVAKVQYMLNQAYSVGRLDHDKDIFLFTISWIEPTGAMMPRDVNDKVDPVLRRMADWYKSYLIWEDSQPNEAP